MMFQSMFGSRFDSKLDSKLDSKRLSTTARLLALAFATSLAFATPSHAQGSSGKGQPAGKGGQAAAPAAPAVDLQEEAAYKAFYDASPQDADTKIKLGQDFVQKYPSSHYAGSVYSALVQAYYAKQDWVNFYASGDKALAIDPNNVDVLAVVGWVIPHVYNPDDLDAAKKLDKAESYEKHAIQVIEALPKPPGLTDEQFSGAKAELLTQAHSGLGLVYFRKNKFEDSATELELATQNPAASDPADFYVLGNDLMNLKRSLEAATVFDKCAQIPGGLQDRCKQSAAAARGLK